MKTMLVYIFIIANLSCTVSKTNNFNTQTEIKNITASHWIAGAKGGGGGVVLNVYFKTEIDTAFIPTKIQFQDREGVLSKINSSQYQANILTMNNTDETIPTPTIKTNLKPTEAKVFFNNNKQNFKITNVKELEMIAYPSVKPSNQ